MVRIQHIRRADRVASVVGAALLAVVVAGCGSGTSGAANAAGTPTGNATERAGGPGGARGGNPGVSGVIAAVSGNSLTATNSQGSTNKITWTSSTRISSQSTGAAGDVVAGTCVSVRQQFSGAMSNRPSGAPTGGAMPSGGVTPTGGPSGSQPSYTVPSSVTATSVTILPAGDCTTSTASGSASPSATSASGIGRGMGGFGGLTGVVSSISGSGFVFKTTGNTAKPVTVTTSSSTTYIKQATASSAVIAAGKCVEARGTTLTSALAATSITISESVNGECTSQAGGFGGGSPNGAAGSGASGNAS